LDVTGFPQENKYIYEEGDHLGILPENDPELVTALLQRLDVKQPNAYFSLQIDDSETKPTHIPPVCTFQDALMKYVDITSPMNIHAFEILLRYCTNENEKNDLETLSRGGKPYEEFISEFPSVLTTLQKFSSVKIPFAELLRILSPLDVRYYSIASSQKVYASQIHICVSVVTYYYSGVKHNGVCSNYLARAQSSQKVRVFVVSAPDFHLSGKQPIILVGPGTGIAPFRGFWQGNDIKRRIYLYFGCRHEDDELYKNEIMEAIAANKLTGYDVAFSRKNIEEKSLRTT